jgi:hypothetical protein
VNSPPKKSLPLFLGIFLLAFPVQGKAHSAEESASLSKVDACRIIEEVYEACGAQITANGRDFSFPLNTGRVNTPCSDGKELSFYDRIESMDVASILMIPYQVGATPLPETRRNWDPGRLRLEPLFRFIYGNSESEVRAQLVSVPFLGQTVKFQSRLGAAQALAKAGRELELAMKNDRDLANFLSPFTSRKKDLRQYGFVWRFIKGTNRLSTHSFGTAIDLLLDEGPQYWLWDEMKANPERAKQGEAAYRDIHYKPTRAPLFNRTAVEIMERNGFIWGGKWNHYDTMHFEYRPELISGSKPDCAPWKEIIADARLQLNRANAWNQTEFSPFGKTEKSKVDGETPRVLVHEDH